MERQRGGGWCTGVKGVQGRRVGGWLTANRLEDNVEQDPRETEQQAGHVD